MNKIIYNFRLLVLRCRILFGYNGQSIMNCTCGHNRDLHPGAIRKCLKLGCNCGWFFPK